MGCSAPLKMVGRSNPSASSSRFLAGGGFPAFDWLVDGNQIFVQQNIKNVCRGSVFGSWVAKVEP